MSNREFFKPFVIFLTVAWLTAFVLLPNLGIFIISFLSRDEANLISLQFNPQNYYHLLDGIYARLFYKSFFIAFFVSVICLILSYPFVYILSRNVLNKRVKDVLLLLVIVPFWTSSLVRTYAMIVILRINGLLNKLLMALGIIREPLEMLYNNSAVIIGLVYALLPFMILPLYTSFEKLNENYVKAAEDLGATKFRIIWEIIIPLTKPGIAVGCILVFLSTLGLFFIPELLGGSKEILLGSLIKNQFLVARDWPFGAAISTILTIIIFIFAAVYAKYQNVNKVVI